MIKKILSLVMTFCILQVTLAFPSSDTVVVSDDATAINPVNSNIAASANIQTAVWGDGRVVTDDTYFQGTGSGSNSYFVVQAPNNRRIKEISFLGFRISGSEDFVFSYSSELSGVYSEAIAESSLISGVKDGWDGKQYVISNLPENTRFVKVKYPSYSDGQGWKYLISSFNFSHEPMQAGVLPVASNDYSRQRIVDDAVSLEGANSYIVKSKNLSAVSWGNPPVDTSFFQPNSNNGGAGECYILITAPTEKSITEFDVTVEHYGALSSDFSISSCGSIDGTYNAEQLQKSTFTAGSGWSGTQFCASALPEGTKFIKVEFPAYTENWKVLLSGYSMVLESDMPLTYMQNGGPLTVQGENFVDSNGNVVRFWGVNVASFYPDKAIAEKIAQNMENRQINLVRHHHNLRNSNDWNWSPTPASLADFNSGSTRNMNAVAWDRFDYFNSKLANHKIYYNFSIESSRSYLPNDASIISGSDEQQWKNAIAALNNLDWKVAIDLRKMLPMIDERAEALSKEFASYFLNRTNQYTGMKYKEDPYLLSLELSNETSTEYAIVCGNTFNKPGLEYFHNKLISLWTNYLLGKTAQYFDLYAPQNQTQINLRAEFLNKLDSDYMKKMKSYITNELGAAKPIIFSNLWRGDNASQLSFSQNDFIEEHLYSNPMIADSKSDYIQSLSKQAASGKPYMIGEFNISETDASDDAYRTMMLLSGSVYGSFNNLSGIEYFAYNHGGNSIGSDGWAVAEYRTPPERSDIIGTVVSDGMVLDHFRTAGLIFKNGYVSQSKQPQVITVDEPYTAGSYAALIKGKYNVKDGWQSVHSYKKRFGKTDVSQSADTALLQEYAGNVITSDTGEIVKDISKRQLSFASDYAEGFSGFLNSQAPSKLSKLQLGSNSGFATVMMVTNDKKPISDSDYLVISKTALTDENIECDMPITLKGMKKAEPGMTKWVMTKTRPRGEEMTADLSQDENGNIALPLNNWHECELRLVKDEGAVTIASVNIMIGGAAANDILNSAGSVEAVTEITNNTDSIVKSNLYLALYDGNTLKKVVVKSSDLLPGTNSCLLGGIQKEAGKGDRIKLILWNGKLSPFGGSWDTSQK